MPKKIQAGTFKKFGMVLLFFIVYLLTIPKLMGFIMPCLHPIPGQVYQSNECAVGFALNMYLGLGIMGMTVILMGSFVYIGRTFLKPVIVLGILYAALLIVSFHWYIPYLDYQVTKAPIVVYDPASLNK